MAPATPTALLQVAVHSGAVPKVGPKLAMRNRALRALPGCAADVRLVGLARKTFALSGWKTMVPGELIEICVPSNDTSPAHGAPSVSRLHDAGSGNAYGGMVAAVSLAADSPSGHAWTVVPRAPPSWISYQNRKEEPAAIFTPEGSAASTEAAGSMGMRIRTDHSEQVPDGQETSIRVSALSHAGSGGGIRPAMLLR